MTSCFIYNSIYAVSTLLKPRLKIKIHLNAVTCKLQRNKIFKIYNSIMVALMWGTARAIIFTQAATFQSSSSHALSKGVVK